MSESRTTYRLRDLLEVAKSPIEMKDSEDYMLASIRRRNGGMFDRGTKKGREILTKTLSRVIPGSFVISKMQVVHGACGMAPLDYGDRCISASYVSLVPRKPERVDIRYLDAYATTKESYDAFIRASHGVHIEKMTFNLDDWLNGSIELPPLPEQKKIAEVLSGIDNARARLVALREKHRALLTSLRQKIFDEHEVSYCTFEEIIEQRDLGTTRRGIGEGSNIPLVKMGDIARGEIRLGANERIEYADDIKDLLLKRGDILFNTRNTPSLVGKTAIFDASTQCCYDNNLMRIRLVPWVSPWFLNHLMNAPHFVQILSSISSGTTSVAAIYWNDLKRIRIPLPSLSRQQQLADSIDAVIEVISGVSSNINSLENIKSATSSDLLSGRKRVRV